MKKFFIVIAASLLFASLACAENSLEFSSTTDFAFYPKSGFVAGGTHFAPLTGFYDSLGLRETLTAQYKIPVPFGDGALVQGNNVTVGGDFVVTPVSVQPDIKISFTPIAFLQFDAGASIGTGWNFFGIDGFLRYDQSGEYKAFSPFKTWLYQFWGCATVMFDTGAIFPGDWNHVVMLASFDFRYWGLLGADSDAEIFKWQSTAGLAQGTRYDINLIVGYQMPLKLSMVGLNCEWSGYFGEPYAEKHKASNGGFTQIDINPLAQVSLTEKDTLTFMLGFSSRRSFKEAHDDVNVEPLLNHSGREWFFNMFVCRWEHKF